MRIPLAILVLLFVGGCSSSLCTNETVVELPSPAVITTQSFSCVNAVRLLIIRPKFLLILSSSMRSETRLWQIATTVASEDRGVGRGRRSNGRGPPNCWYGMMTALEFSLAIPMFTTSAFPTSRCILSMAGKSSCAERLPITSAGQRYWPPRTILRFASLKAAINVASGRQRKKSSIATV